jgi:hypothetical protein
MRNAKHVGLDIAHSFGMALGKPISINEETSQIKEGILSSKTSEPKTLNELIDEKTITVIVTTNVVFELRTNVKNL